MLIRLHIIILQIKNYLLMMADNDFDIEDDLEIEQLRARHERIQKLKQAMYASSESQSHSQIKPLRESNSNLSRIARLSTKTNLSHTKKSFDKQVKTRPSFKETSIKDTSLKDILNSSRCQERIQPVATKPKVLPQRKSGPIQNNVVQRLYERNQQTKAKILQKQENLIKQEISLTKPKPDINNKSKEISKNRTNQILLDTQSNLSKRKDISPMIEKSVPSRTQSVKSAKTFLKQEIRSEEFLKSQEEWLKSRNADLLKKRIEMKSRELEDCTYKPDLLSTKRRTVKGRFKENDMSTSRAISMIDSSVCWERMK